MATGGGNFDQPEIPAASWEGQVRLADGYDRFVRRFGTGPNVLLCQHGGPGVDHRSLLPLASLADDRLQVVFYDQLGGGASSRPDRDELWTVETFVREFVGLVDALDSDGVHLLGQSWGGMLALECALATPKLVRSLVLCDSLAAISHAREGFAEILDDAPDAVRVALEGNHPFDPSDDSDLGRGIANVFATHLRRSHPFDLERSRRELAELSGVLFDYIGPAYEVMWGANEFAPDGNLRDWSVVDRLGEITAPALVICGAYDELTPERCHRPLVEGLPDARWLILGQSSHMIFHEVEADLALAAIRGFLLDLPS
ncbi:MAG TPA: proline iminopeptidase-family hydrolase [Solirubrobacterales bacterium]|nr:proline iminopeptidase-family hydrolase [Solirubrobacterales bacterium]